MRTLSSYISKRTTRDLPDIGARWVSRSEIPLEEDAGIPVGGHPSEGLWLLPSRQHTITVGRTGSGKTRSLALPGILMNALSKRKSNLLIVDAKGTLFSSTSGALREGGYTIRLVNMRSPATPNTWNPLAAATDAYRKRDRKSAEDIVDNLTESLKKTIESSKDKYWENAMADLVASVYFALLDSDKKSNPSLCDIADAVSGGPTKLKELANAAGADSGGRLRASISASAASETWGSIQGIFFAALSFFRSSTGRRVASTSNFDPVKDILSEKKPVAVFVISPDESGSCDGYVASLFDAVYQGYTAQFELRGLEGKSLPGVRCFIDEAARFPFSKMNALMSTARSREFFVHLFFQSFSQLLEGNRYSEAEAAVLVEQASAVFCMSNVDERIIKYLSRRSGGIVTPETVTALGTGEAIVSRLDKPIARTRLSPVDEYVEAGLFDELHAAIPKNDGQGVAEGIDAGIEKALLRNMDDVSMAELSEIVRELAKCSSPSNERKFHEACRLAANGLTAWADRSFDSCELFISSMLDDLPYNGLLGDTVYLAAMNALLKQCCKHGPKGYSPDIRSFCDKAIERISADLALSFGSDSWPEDIFVTQESLLAGTGLTSFMLELSSDGYNSFKGIPQFRAHLEKHIRSKSGIVRLAVSAWIRNKKSEHKKGKRPIDELFDPCPDATAFESMVAQGSACRAFGFARANAYDDFLDAIVMRKKAVPQTRHAEQSALPLEPEPSLEGDHDNRGSAKLQDAKCELKKLSAMDDCERLARLGYAVEFIGDKPKKGHGNLVCRMGAKDFHEALYRMFEVRFGGFDPKVESQAKLRRSILAKVVHSERDGLVLLPADVIAGLGDVLESIAGC